MHPKFVSFALSAMLFTMCFPAAAQQPGKVPRIGYLSVSSLSAMADRIEAFRQGLRELGCVEGEEHPHRVAIWRRKT
jgi:putative tryptophan/tyrosine transport system substrate-binding protein